MRHIAAATVIAVSLLSPSLSWAEPAPSTVQATENYAAWVDERTDLWESELEWLSLAVQPAQAASLQQAQKQLESLRQDLRNQPTAELSDSLEENLVGRVYRLERRLEKLSISVQDHPIFLTRNSGE